MKLSTGIVGIGAAAIALSYLKPGIINDLMSGTKDQISMTLIGSPAEAEKQIIRAADNEAQARAAIASFDSRVEHLEIKYGGTVTLVVGDFYIAPDHGDSLFPEMGGGQTATLSTGGSTIEIRLDNVPQSVTDNTIRD